LVYRRAVICSTLSCDRSLPAWRVYPPRRVFPMEKADALSGAIDAYV
jgi:hypothetical protein